MEPSSVDPALNVKRARAQLQDRGEIPEGLLPEAIRRSWKRCLTMGLNAQESAAADAPAENFADITECNRLLITHAQPVMENLREQIENTHSTVILTDAHGLILRSLGDSDFMHKAARVALQPGVVWDESNKGTNAIGTALFEQRPVLVHGGEHFVSSNACLTCSASPICNPQGAIVGALDVSGDHRSCQQHTLALVRMSVQMIENRLFREDFFDCVYLRFHTRPEFIGTLCEGIAVFSADGHFVSANRSAIFQLGIDLPKLREMPFSALFDLPFETLFKEASATRPLALQMHNGVRVLGLPEFGTELLRRRKTIPRFKQPAARARTPRDLEVHMLASLNHGDACMASAIEKARKVLGRDIALLIIGETGTGKELFARAFHNDSPRRAGPFVAVNCAAIPDGLIESELFGYEEGAFTGGRRKGAPGKLVQADRGTLFLDEIGDMPLPMQARLLRVLQERTVTPLGGVKCLPVDIAVICASNRNLRDLISKGQFREDLYYRLNGLVVTLPPLRDRSDIAKLASLLVVNESRGRLQASIHQEVTRLFESHPWPGNIRQLATLLRTAIAMLGNDAVITRAHLSDDFLEDAIDKPAVSMTRDKLALDESSIGSLDALEKCARRKMVEIYDGNISAAARHLGISRNTLYRKLKSA
ncbi:MAG: sigma-54-dependent Fis family transcriptional regulator [Burkholderiales bacterium]|nr:sigma-54-dependent Fis family transcriptional regulator [Burkholderiales bacterium]